MARRRMFSLDVVDTDAFLDLPASTQALYFHLGMRADDDGFVSSPKRITRTVSCSADDLNLLVLKGFLIPFKSGVCVIVDWKRNNDFKRDRFHPTVYQTEYKKLGVENRRYFLLDTECLQDVSRLETESNLVYSNLVQSSCGCSPAREGDQVTTNRQPSNDQLPAEDERRPLLSPAPLLESVKEYARELGTSEEEAAKFFDYNAARGWLVSGKPCADWKALFRSWMSHAKPAAKDSPSGYSEAELEEARLYSL